MNFFQKSLEIIKQKQQLLAILVFGLVASMIWIAVTLISTQRQSSLSPELKKLAQPLTPTIDEEVLQKIENQRFYSEKELAAFPIYRLVQSPVTGGEVVLPMGEELEPSPAEEQEEEQSDLSQAGEATQSLRVDEISTTSAEQL